MEKASRYASEREVFGKPIGANQGVQFPIARAHVAVEAADLVRWKAAALFDAGEPCGPEANMAKFLASNASWEAANACLDTHGGWGFAVELDVERKFRETRLYQVAPVPNTLVLGYVGHHVLRSAALVLSGTLSPMATFPIVRLRRFRRTAPLARARARDAARPFEPRLSAVRLSRRRASSSRCPA